jgi:ribokinase
MPATDQIIVIGSSNTDFIMKLERLPNKGETVTNATFMQTFGGKGANAAVGAARAGGNVSFVNCVGDDAFGPLIIAAMRDAGVHTEHITQVAGIASGSALVMIDVRGDNYLSVAPGANYCLTPEHIRALSAELAAAAMIVLQYEILPETLYTAIDMATSFGRPVLFNFAPARPIDERYLQQIELLVVNEIEAAYLAGVSIDSHEQALDAAHALLERGPRAVMITLGARGVAVASADERFIVPAYPVEVVDTTAAGDIFCGALAVALVEGRSLFESVGFANAAAALSVTQLGAQPSAPSRAAIEAFIERHRAGTAAAPSG